MRIKDGFVLREIAGQIMVIATGEASKNFHGMIKLNETGRDIFVALQEKCSEEEIVARLQEKYEIDFEKAAEDTKAFLKQMKDAGFLADE